MWIVHACSSLTAPCQPRTYGELAEFLAALSLAVLAIIFGCFGLLALLEWIDGWL